MSVLKSTVKFHRTSMRPVRCLPASRALSRHVQLAGTNSTIKTSQLSRLSSKQLLPRVKDNHCSKFADPQQCKEAQRHSASHSIAASTVGLASLQYFLTSGNAYAAKVCLDVPDWIAAFDLGDAVFHSPVVAVGAAVLALLLFPKLIKVSRVQIRDLVHCNLQICLSVIASIDNPMPGSSDIQLVMTNSSVVSGYQGNLITAA